MNYLPSAIVAVAANIAFLGAASAQVITTWTATDDLYTNKTSNLVLNEDTNRLLVGVTQYGYLRFETASAYSYSNLNNIQSATLRIFLPYNAGNPTSSLSVTAQNILDSSDNWNDGGSNPAVGDVFTPGLGALQSTTSVTGSNNPGIYFDWDVTSLVKSANAGLGNNIMSFRLEMTGGTFRFAGTDHVSGFYPQLVVTSVPEPQSWMLLGLGLAVLVVSRRRLSRVSAAL